MAGPARSGHWDAVSPLGHEPGPHGPARAGYPSILQVKPGPGLRPDPGVVLALSPSLPHRNTCHLEYPVPRLSF